MTKPKAQSLQPIALMLMLMVIGAAEAGERELVVLPVAVYQQTVSWGWDLASRYSPDSSKVLVDKHGNIPFSTAEDTLLKTFLDAGFIPESQIQGWLEENGWNAEGRE